MSGFYRPDREGMADLMRSPEIAGHVERVAKEGARVAEQIAPVESGTYAAGFEVESGHEVIAGERRAASRIVNRVPYAAAVENADRVLRRVADVIEGGGRG